MARTLDDIEAALGAEALQQRVQAVEDEARSLQRALELVADGMSASAALATVFPDAPVESMRRRLRRYQQGGTDALVSRRYPPPQELKMTPEVRQGLSVLARADPQADAGVLAKRLAEVFDIEVSASLVQQVLRELGLARPVGRRPHKNAVPPPDPQQTATVEALSLAGAELLLATEQLTGAVAALTGAIEQHLAALPAPGGPVHDDRGHRDEQGRFLPSYNAPQPRQAEALGHKFQTVQRRREVIDLQQMRVTRESEQTLLRKNLGLVLLPLVVRGGRWSELQHWRGEQLGELTGFAYQPSTLDKYLRQLKFAGAAQTSRDAVASFWLSAEGDVYDEATGAIVLYIDATTKPISTHHFSRSSRVSRTGRVQPATTTMTLHSGAGTPLVFDSFSGTASLSSHAVDFLEQFEQYAGAGTVRRMVVMDRDAHAIALFKAFEGRWGFIIPLRSNVVGNNARFEAQAPWSLYNADGDEVSEAKLWLRDARSGEDDLLVRVVARRRHRSGKVSWYATNRDADEIPAADVLRLYFERWPLQERVYRDISGTVGIEVHHGFGKQLVDNVAVIDNLDRLQLQIERIERRLSQDTERAEALATEHKLFTRALEAHQPQITAQRSAFEAALHAALPREGLDEAHRQLRQWEKWESATEQRIAQMAAAEDALQQQINKTTMSRDRKSAQAAELRGRVQIFTVDVELDEIMTGYKLTFLNLCQVLQREYLDTHMEIETLIKAVLTLPGERVRTPSVETVRIYKVARDPQTMSAVERAAERLSAQQLKRGDRLLRFEVVEPPPRVRQVDPNQL